MFSDPHSSHFCPSEQAFPTQKDLSSVFWERSAWGLAHWLWNHLLHYDTSLPRWKVDPFLFPSFFSPLHYPLLPSTSLFISLQFWNTVPKKARPLSSHSCSSRLLKKPLVFFFFLRSGVWPIRIGCGHRSKWSESELLKTIFHFALQTCINRHKRGWEFASKQTVFKVLSHGNQNEHWHKGEAKYT